MPSTSPKDTTKAAFIKYLNDKTLVFNNQIITGLLLERNGCTIVNSVKLTTPQCSKIDRPILF